MQEKELAMGTPAAEAASRAGFGDYSSFFRAYRKMFGCAPTDKTAMELPDMDKSGDFRQFPNGAFMPSLYNLYTSVFTFNTIFLNDVA